MKFLVIFVFFLNVAQGQDEFRPPANSESRIIQGWPAIRSQFPFMVRLEMRLATSTRFCGGSLISTRHVLTSANCLDKVSVVKVLIGSTDASQPSRSVETTKFIAHPQFNSVNMRNDIGLVDMQADVPITAGISPIKLVPLSQVYVSFENRTATVAGWGSTSNNGNQTQHLNYVNTTVISNLRCEAAFGSLVQPSNVCTVGLDTPAQGACTGDGGGPLFVDDSDGRMMQIGIASFFSTEGCSSSSPNAFLRPHYYWTWISEWTGIPVRP